jgi:hypothetical protein
MKATSVVVLFVLSLAAVARGEPAARVRVLDQPSAAALAEAPVVVHVVSGAPGVFAATGTTQLSGTVGGWRYLRIVLAPRLRPRERVAVLAHELQHVHEIAASDATTQAEVRDLYERIGRRVPGACSAFETVAAADAGMRVWREMRVVREMRTPAARAQ